jgi:FkbM family methyltransferase
MKLFLEIVFKNTYKVLVNSNYRTFLRLAFLHGNKPRYSKTRVNILEYKITLADPLSFIWQFQEIFVDEIYKFKSQTNSPVIFDCGANVGTSCLYFKKIFPNAKLKAFEADPEIAKILLLNLRDVKDVQVINKAIWINNNGIEISLEGADAASMYGNKNKVKVDSVRLKDLIETEEKIDMLKIDIEGAEVDVIKDCKESLGKVENIFIEFHSFINYKQELNVILQILTENNFRYFIKQPVDRNIPFINKTNKNYPEMDLQLNIFAYKIEK